nr:uncharacterized protein LOC115258134 [Aedes albopictus]
MISNQAATVRNSANATAVSFEEYRHAEAVKFAFSSEGTTIIVALEAKNGIRMRHHQSGNQRIQEVRYLLRLHHRLTIPSWAKFAHQVQSNKRDGKIGSTIIGVATLAEDVQTFPEKNAQLNTIILAIILKISIRTISSECGKTNTS